MPVRKGSHAANFSRVAWADQVIFLGVELGDHAPG